MEDSTVSRRDMVKGIAGAALGAAAVGAGATAAFADETAGTDAGAAQGFAEWALEGGNSGSTAATYYLEGDENAPTDEELTQMLQAANTYFQCHGLTGVHYVVVRDADVQKEMFSFMGATGSGTVAVLCFADGLRDQDIHSEQYNIPGAQNDDPQYWQMPYALVELGWSLGYLNIAARELGYRMHAYGALNIPNLTTGEVMPFDTAGTWEYITRGMWDTDKYLQPKDGGDPFEHYTMALGRDIECLGNMTMVCACLIGKIDEVDAVSGATATQDYKEGIRNNFDFWD